MLPLRAQSPFSRCLEMSMPRSPPNVMAARSLAAPRSPGPDRHLLTRQQSPEETRSLVFDAEDQVGAVAPDLCIGTGAAPAETASDLLRTQIRNPKGVRELPGERRQCRVLGAASLYHRDEPRILFPDSRGTD